MIGVSELIEVVGLPVELLVEGVDSVTQSDLDKLLLLCQAPGYHVHVQRGYPSCPVCNYSVAKLLLEFGSLTEAVVSADVLLPWSGGFFVFPTITYHLCSAHALRLPEAFIDALRILSFGDIDTDDMKREFLTAAAAAPSTCPKLGNPTVEP